MLLWMVEAWVKEQRTLLTETVPGGSDRGTFAAHREACALEALTIATARIQVLPGVCEPGVVPRTGVPLEIQGTRCGPKLIDLHLGPRERRLTVGALPQEQRVQTLTDVIGGIHA